MERGLIWADAVLTVHATNAAVIAFENVYFILALYS